MMQGPVDYYTPWRAAFARPLSVSVVAWVGIFFGAMGVICGGLGLLMGEVMVARFSAFRGANVAWNTAQLLAGLVGIVQSLVLLLTSLGCLYMRPAARRVMIGYAIFAIAWALGMLAMQVAHTPDVARDAAALNAAMLCGSFLLSCALPVAILIVMTRSHVRSAFAHSGMFWYPTAYAMPQPPGVMSAGGNDLQTP